MNDDERIIRLEERYTHLQEHVTAQDRTLLEWGEALDRLRRELTDVRELLAGGSADPDPLGEERPPHY